MQALYWCWVYFRLVLTLGNYSHIRCINPSCIRLQKWVFFISYRLFLFIVLVAYYMHLFLSHISTKQTIFTLKGCITTFHTYLHPLGWYWGISCSYHPAYQPLADIWAHLGHIHPSNTSRSNLWLLMGLIHGLIRCSSRAITNESTTNESTK